MPNTLRDVCSSADRAGHDDRELFRGGAKSSLETARLLFAIVEIQKGVHDMIRLGSLALLLLIVPVIASAQSDGVERGQKVYAAQKCNICHSVAGVGNKRGALDEVGSKLSADEIRQWIVDAPAMAVKTKAERKPPMKAYATLPREDLDGLVAYMQSLKK